MYLGFKIYSFPDYLCRFYAHLMCVCGGLGKSAEKY